MRIDTIEDYEGLSGFQHLEKRDSLSDNQRNYIEEVLSLGNRDLLVSRIDELNDCEPPKAIDADPEVADMLMPVIEEIDPTYLEAPQDGIQIEEISDRMTQIEGVEYSEWKKLTFEERMNVLQQVECEVANIAHRPVCSVDCKRLGEGHYGYYTPGDDCITLNADCVRSDSFSDYKEALDTLIHEGRHAYQEYNLNGREVHPRQGDISNWKMNEKDYGYQDAGHYGFKLYELQPVEADARAFAEDVLKRYQYKMA